MHEPSDLAKRQIRMNRVARFSIRPESTRRCPPRLTLLQSHSQRVTLRCCKCLKFSYNRNMKYANNIAAIDELSASEGVFTTAQAQRLGISRNALSHAYKVGRLERVAHGAYRLSGAPSGPARAPRKSPLRIRPERPIMKYKTPAALEMAVKEAAKKSPLASTAPSPAFTSTGCCAASSATRIRPLS